MSTQATKRDGHRAATSSAIFIPGLLLASILMAGLAVVEPGRLNSQIGFGAVALCFVGAATTIWMASGLGLRQSLVDGQLGPYFALSAAIVYGLASLIWVDVPPAQQAAIISLDSIVAGIFIVSVALCCFTIAYIGVGGKASRIASIQLERALGTARTVRVGQRPAWVLFILGASAVVIEVATGRFGYLSDPGVITSTGSPIAQPLAILSSFGVFAVALSASDAARGQHRARGLLSLSVLLLAETSLGAITGDKEPVVMAFVAGLLGWSTGIGRVPIIAAASVILGFVFVLVPFNNSYRSLANVSVGARLSLPEQVGLVGQGDLETLIFGSQTAAPTPQRQSLERISRIGDVAVIVQKTGSAVPYRPVSELLGAPFLGIVPRALWADKPVLDTGYVFSQEYYDKPALAFTSDPVTPEGDLWRHGGWPVLIGGMVVLGASVRVLDTVTARPGDLPLRLFLILSFIPVLVKHELDAVQLVASAPVLLLGVAMAARLVAVRHRTDSLI